MTVSTKNPGSKKNSVKAEFDVIIVGGGMVGLSVAAGLVENFNVAVVESSSLNENFLKQTSVRVSAITRGSENWLQSLSAWQQIPSTRLSAYQKMHIWDAQGNGQVDFNCADNAQPNLGHIIENSVIQTALLLSLKAAIKSGRLHIFANTRASSVQIDRDDAGLTLEDGSQLSGKLLIAADGANSWLRNQLAFPMQIEPYQQSALVALIESENTHQRTAWQKFLKTGPLAFLPMKQKNLHSIVWSLDEDLVGDLLNFEEEEFISLLQDSIGSKFGKLKLVSERFAFPLIARHASSYIQHRTVLVGDAAHTIHPLAGQGVNLGFRDAKGLVETLINGKKKGIEPGSKTLLRQYERARKGDNLQVQKAMSLLKQGFGSERSTVVSIRNIGMNLLNSNTTIKKQLVKTAMDLSG